MDQQQIHQYHHLHFKLMLRRYLMKQRDCSATRGLVLNNFRQVPLALFDEVVDECIQEGLLAVSTGHLNSVRYTWHDGDLVASGRN
jgi:hypothetical protein